MNRWWRLAITTWSVNPGRTGAVVLSVALGVGIVVIVTNFFETARVALAEEVVRPLMGAAHVSVHPVGAHWSSIDATLAGKIEELDNVDHVTARLRRRGRLVPIVQADQLLEESWWHVDAIGINPATEAPFLSLPNLEGRLIQEGERGVVIIERSPTSAWKLELGDEVLLTPFYGGPKNEFTVVGLFDTQRVAEFQHTNAYVPLLDLQELEQAPNMVSAIDIVLRNPEPKAMTTCQRSIERIIAGGAIVNPVRVETAAARQMVLSEAERITRMLLMLIAMISMLTSFFIILTTQSVGFTQRRPQLGIMRCIGLTRRQLAGMLMLELVPLCLLGILLGLLGGFVVGYVILESTSELSMSMVISPWCIYLSVASGLLTTAVSTGMLILQVGRVTPLEAVLVSAKPARRSLLWGASALGVICLAVHQWMAVAGDRTQWLSTGFAILGTGLLYLGYVLLVPAFVLLLGRPIARGVGRLMGVGAKLTEDPFVRAPWRTTGACWVLMVGLSLIVYVAVRAQSILDIWDYPAQLPSAFVWSSEYVPSATIDRVSQLPGVSATTVSTDVPCKIETPDAAKSGKKSSVVESFLKRLTRPVFVAGDPDALLDMVQVAFTQGSREDAVPKLKQGGYVLVPPETARNKGLRVGDRVRVTVLGRSADFEVAGVVESPAMDLAVTAFQARSYMQIAAASAILGTRSDLKDKFGLDVVSMFMCDIELVETAAPPGFDWNQLPVTSDELAVATALRQWKPLMPEEHGVLDELLPAVEQWQASVRSNAEMAAKPLSIPPAEIREPLLRYAKAIQWLRYSSRSKSRTPQENWNVLRERLILLHIAGEMERPDAIIGSLRRLKQQVDKLLHRALATMTWLPGVLLVVAAIGIGNLMTISVHQRTRQIAVLRAIGAEKSQVLRLILAEAIAIGLLGSVMGVALGLHEADSANRVILGITDVTLAFIIPVGTVALGIGLTVGICILAAIAPARYACRNNIIEAMQTV